jgi:hypothetical protein
MTVLLTISGIIAALILFRWARLLAMVCLICTAAYFCHEFEAWKAQQIAMGHAASDN